MMRDVKFTDLINRSIERVGVVLFNPFSLKKWAKLLFIACLSGAISGGGIGGGGGGTHSEKKAEADSVINSEYPAAISTSEVEAVAAVSKTPVSSGASSKGRRVQSEERFKKMIGDAVAPIMLWPAAVLSTVIFCVTFALLALMLLFMWLGARFKFVWFDAIVKNRDAIREPFKAYKKEGDSIFRLWLIVSLGFLVFLGILAAWVIFTLISVNFFKLGWADAGGAVVSLSLAVVVFIGAMIALSLWSVMVEHFVMTIMAIDRSTFGPAWQKFWDIYKNNTKDFWLYVLVLIGLGIVSSMAQGVVFVVIVIGFLIIGALVLGLGYLIFAVVMKAKVFFWIFAVIVAVPSAVAGIVMLFAIGLPFAVFFRNFSLYFLSSLNCGYTPLTWINPQVKV